jgi:ABC-2 type transport system permease protein
MNKAVATPSSSLPFFVKSELFVFLKNPLSIFWTFAYPVILFVILNTIFGNQPTPAGGISYSGFLITGLVVLTIVSTSLFNITIPLIEMRSQSRLKMFAVMPISKVDFLFGFALSRTIILCIYGCVFIFALTHLIPNAEALDVRQFIFLTILMAAGATVMIGISVLLTSAIKSTGSAYAVVNIINVPILFLSNLFIPTAIFPSMLKTASNYSPVYQFVEELRAIYMGTIDVTTFGMWIAALLIAGFLFIRLGAGAFSWQTETSS